MQVRGGDQGSSIWSSRIRRSPLPGRDSDRSDASAADPRSTPLGNALKFTDRGIGVRLIVTAEDRRRFGAAQDWNSISIDTGIGIDARAAWRGSSNRSPRSDCIHDATVRRHRTRTRHLAGALPDMLGGGIRIVENEVRTSRHPHHRVTIDPGHAGRRRITTTSLAEAVVAATCPTDSRPTTATTGYRFCTGSRVSACAAGGGRTVDNQRSDFIHPRARPALDIAVVDNGRLAM